MRKTPLYDEHIRLGGKMVDFGGYMLPLQYTGIVNEHIAVRQTVGLFDVSHMGEFLVEGEDAEAFLQKLLTNDIAKLQPGRVMYTIMCLPDGGTIDDLLTYKLAEHRYMLVPNAANIGPDWDWLQEVASEFPNLKLTDKSNDTALLALQGPLAERFLSELAPTYKADTLRFYRFEEGVKIAGVNCLLSRTGYTGEDGFEIYHSPEHSGHLWRILTGLEIEGVKVTPAGLGARDTLRMEAALPLYGHELTREISPVDAGLNRFIKFEKKGFIGKDALVERIEASDRNILVGLVAAERGIARQGYDVYRYGKLIGTITSGGVAPSLKENVSMALVSDFSLAEGDFVQVQIRSRMIEHKVVSLPFYKREKK